MLSKTDLLILGIIAEKPINPYAIIKLINYKRNSIRRYVPPQTVYGIVNNLSKKKLITGHKQKNGNMPDKTVYSITKKGEEVIRRNLITYLNAPEDNLSELVLSVILVGFLEKEVVLQALREQRNKIEQEIATSQELSKKVTIPEELYTRLIVAEHTLKTLHLNLETVNRLIEKIQADKEWGNFPVPWWRNEYLRNGESTGKQEYPQKLS